MSLSHSTLSSLASSADRRLDERRHIFPYMDAALETARQFRADTAADLRKALWGGEGETSTKPARL